MPKPEAANVNEILLRKGELSEKIRKEETEYVILFADLTKSTEYRRTESTLQSLDKVWVHNDIVSKIIEKFEGEIIKWLGDGVMGAFHLIKENALAYAVNASIEIQREFEKYNKEMPKPHQIESKIGLAMGKCFPYKDSNGGLEDLLGTMVDTAARIQSIAQPRQILIHERIAREIQIDKLIFKDKKRKNLIYPVFKKKMLKGLEAADIYEVTWLRRFGKGEPPPISLTSLDEVAQIERDAEEIWVYTPTLLFDDMLKKTILQNLKEEKSYSYVLPNRLEVKTALDALKNYWENNGGDITKVKHNFLKEPCVLTTIAVYNPKREDSCVIVSLPLSQERRFPIEEFHEVYLLTHIAEVTFYTALLGELLKFTCGE